MSTLRKDVNKYSNTVIYQSIKVGGQKTLAKIFVENNCSSYKRRKKMIIKKLCVTGIK
jgi:hypothetical protein